MMTRFTIVAALLLVTDTLVHAHGISCSVEHAGQAVVVHCTYEGNTPVRGAEVQIFAPGEDQTPFQAATSDADGHVAFVPNTEGVWRFVIDDGTGHRSETRVSVAADVVTALDSETAHHNTDRGYSLNDLETHSLSDQTSSIPLVYRIVFGLALIIGVSGFWYGFKARKK